MRAERGVLELWDVANASDEPHPFHVHATQFRLVSRSSGALRGAHGHVRDEIPRGSEVADGPYSVILEQVTNGVAVRMAVPYLLLGGSAEAAGLAVTRRRLRGLNRTSRLRCEASAARPDARPTVRPLLRAVYNRAGMTPLRIEVDRSELAELCRHHHIRRLSLFGSVLRHDFGPTSDVDVLVEFEPGHTPGLAFMQIERELSRLFGGRVVDLVTPRFLNHRIRDRILAEAQTQYAA